MAERDEAAASRSSGLPPNKVYFTDPPNPAGLKSTEEMEHKARALEQLAQKADDPMQLSLVGALIATQIVHVSSEIETVAQEIRTYDRGSPGDKARLECANRIGWQAALCERLVEISAYVHAQLEKLAEKAEALEPVEVAES